MKKSGKRLGKGRDESRPLFDPARGRPAAPHGHPLTRAKPEERAHPAERKVKHKSRPGQSE